MNNNKKMLIIKMPYWLGIVADALWASALFFPSIFAVLTGRSEFSPDLEMRLIMWIGGTLMLGWTLLLIWAVNEPIERRMVIILTAFPVVFGMLIITVVQYNTGNTFIIWAMIKTIILIVSMSYSFLLASKIAKNKNEN